MKFFVIFCGDIVSGAGFLSTPRCAILLAVRLRSTALGPGEDCTRALSAPHC